ncbi:erythromycin esterase family protein [Marinigracilibium pacificum]|uniref:Erythromycin esterase family protein n=1 Tax=Marinigracilibium pacificum TaxID=2729599 RepID=A0A848J8N8_9BACT|nr:erythromycin esterase family protein [Marinigracilibium pacificum]NMM50794.1 erythromycin esterase family protein [Marinigracilibium pacificum]
MRKIFGAVLIFLATTINAQDDKVIQWINNNLIEIENQDLDSGLVAFHNNIPEKFKNASIFGFGEATHHGREFFTIKAKFFKYLVENLGVRAFIMEEFKMAESGINEWISGGEGDINTIANNFDYYLWQTEEVIDLLLWMRNYNLDKPESDQIRFYGMDIQSVVGINNEIRAFIKKYDIPVSEEFLSVIDSCSYNQIDSEKVSLWNEKLNEIEKVILENEGTFTAEQRKDFRSAGRALSYIIKHINYLKHPGNGVRDQLMFENVKWIINNETKNGKAFIWAHNEHVNNIEVSPMGSGWVSLGGHLKNFYDNKYYSVYFDFGKGELMGIVRDKNKPVHWNIYEIDKPFQNTYAETLFKADKEIYFIDIESVNNIEVEKFFSYPKKQLLLGGPGYNPKVKNRALVRKNYMETCDGLIFVKNISVPRYIRN